MNLPNKLTVFRMFMVPVFLFLFCVPLPFSDTALRIIIAAVFAVVSLTDMIDGKIARKYNMITDFGKFMDPLADKFLVISAFRFKRSITFSTIVLETAYKYIFLNPLTSSTYFCLEKLNLRLSVLCSG